jgi:hypothetical protein
MKVICVENKHGNANFTVGEMYEVVGNSITCNFVKLNMPKNIYYKNNSFKYAFCEFEEERRVVLKQKIIDLGFTKGSIIDIEEDSVDVKFWFCFMWKKNNIDSCGREYFSGKTEEEVLNQIIDFASNRDKGDWILRLEGE